MAHQDAASAQNRLYRMKKIFTKEFVIGLSVVIAIVILVFGIDYLKGINLFQPTNFYTVDYDNVAGLEKSAPVTINGFKVGQVRDIEFDYEKPGKIKVIMALDKNLRLPEGSKAMLASTLLSGGYIEIVCGESSKMLEKGSALEPIAGSDLMASLQAEVMPKINGILPKVDSLLYNLNMLVADPALTASIRRLDGITNNVLLASNGLNTTMNGHLPGIMGKANVAMTHLDTITANLAVLSYDLKQMPLQPTMENVQRITTNLEAFSAQLNNPNSTLGMLTKDPELYNRLNTVAADVDSLIVDIKKNPKRYISIKLL